MSRPSPDCCPECGSTVRGIAEVRVLLGGTEFWLDYTGALAHGDTNPGDSLVRVTFACPQGHGWTLEIGEIADERAPADGAIN